MESKNLKEARWKVRISDEAVEELKVLRFVTEKGKKTGFFKRLLKFLRFKT